MEKSGLYYAVKILLYPVYFIYGLIYLLAFPIEKLLGTMNIDLGIKEEIKDIYRAENIKKYYVYAFFRFINVGLLFYFLYKLVHTSIFKLGELKKLFTVLFVCAGVVLFLHFFKRFLFRKMGITPFREVREKDMNGRKFEIYCADMLRANGYKNVRITKASGDQGVDIVAERKNEKYAIQCKYYSSPLGNKPVQEVHAGRTFYDCDKAIVMTNNKFTKGAVELAESVDVKLWPSILITDNGRGLVTFWYVIDIIIMAVCSFILFGNMDNFAGIVMLAVLIAYTMLFLILCAGFFVVKDLAYYKKNLAYLNEAELEGYKDAIKELATTADEYENLALNTEELEAFIYAMRHMEDIYGQIEEHEGSDIIPAEVEDKMDAFYQNRHIMEIEFVERAYTKDEQGRFLISPSDYEDMEFFSEEAKEYLISNKATDEEIW